MTGNELIQKIQELLNKEDVYERIINRVRVEIEDLDRMAELSDAYGTGQGRLAAIRLRDIAERLRVALDGVDSGGGR